MEKKIYYPNGFAKIISIFFIALVVIVVLSVFRAMPEVFTVEGLFTKFFLFSCLIFAVLFVGYTALLFFDVSRTYLELSDDGVIFASTGYRIYTPWENIDDIGWTRLSRTFPSIIQLKEPAVVGELSLEEGKLSRRAVTEKRSWWMGNWQLKMEAQYTHSIRLPAILFRRTDKQDGSMDQYLWYYVPQVMENRVEHGK